MFSIYRGTSRLAQISRSSSIYKVIADISYSTTPSIQATEIKLLRQSKGLQVTFNSGESFSIPAELLRVESPAAAASTSIVFGKRNIGIYDIEPVGRYAVKLKFDDLHSSGVYSWELLHDLGKNKFHRIKTYLKMLKQHGRSRDLRTSGTRKKKKEETKTSMT